LKKEDLLLPFLIVGIPPPPTAINFGKPEQIELEKITVSQAFKYIDEGHFAPGSMLPKVTAAIDFAQSKEGRVAIISSLENAKKAISGETGTRIYI